MTALYPIRVPNTDLYAYGLDAADMQHGLIVTNAPLFHEFIKTLIGPDKLADLKLTEKVKADYINLYDEYKALLAAYERDTGRKWVYEEGEQ